MTTLPDRWMADATLEGRGQPHAESVYLVSQVAKLPACSSPMVEWCGGLQAHMLSIRFTDLLKSGSPPSQPRHPSLSAQVGLLPKVYTCKAVLRVGTGSSVPPSPT